MEGVVPLKWDPGLQDAFVGHACGRRGRSCFLILVLGLLVAPLLANGEQAAKVFRIEFLSADVPAGISDLMEAFHHGLRDLGTAEGQNLVIVYRFARGNVNRLPNMAAELVRLKVNITATGIRLGI